MKHKLSHLLFFILFLIPCISFSATITGKVVSVADGDTITVLTSQNKQITIRLAAIDTPEKGQAFGQKAKDFTSSMVAGKNVNIEPETIDRYGRTVGIVSVNGSNLNEQIVRHGYGWVYRQYCKGAFCADWLQLEKQAREAGIGLWADKNPTPPWEWRQSQRNGDNNTGVTASVASGTGIYHGNRRSHVFHGSSCRDYNCKNCTVMLESIQEAENAGFHRHRACVK